MKLKVGDIVRIRDHKFNNLWRITDTFLGPFSSQIVCNVISVSGNFHDSWYESYLEKVEFDTELEKLIYEV